MYTRFLTLFFTLLLVQTSMAESTKVRVQPLRGLLVKKNYSAPGTVVAVNQSIISAEIPARINHIAVRVGDTVERGVILMQLDCRSYQNAVKRVRAEVDSMAAQRKLAQRQLHRAQSLVAEDSLSAQSLDQRVAELDISIANMKQREAALDDALLAVERCTIRAPYRAAIVARMAGEGTMAAAGVPILEIVSLNEVELSAQVPVAHIDSLINAEKVYFSTDTGQQEVNFRVISPVVNVTTNTRDIRFSSESLLPGNNGRLSWYSAPLLPANLVTQRDGQLGVFIAKRAGEQTIASFERLVDALEGRPAPFDLPDDTQVIIEGRNNIRDGDLITIENQ